MGLERLLRSQEEDDEEELCMVQTGTAIAILLGVEEARLEKV